MTVFSPDEKNVAVASDDTPIVLFDVTGAVITMFGKEESARFSTDGALFSNDGRLLISRDAKNQVHFWNVTTQRLVYELELNSGGQSDLKLTKLGRLFAITLVEKRFDVFELQSATGSHLAVGQGMIQQN